jgi:hypothetical protein
VGAPLPGRTHEVQKLLNRTVEKIEEATKRAEYLTLIKDKLESLFFSEGDIVLTKSGDSAIVCGIGFADSQDHTAMEINETLCNKLNATLATKKGYVKVPVDDILPFNTTTKVLYSNERD